VAVIKLKKRHTRKTLRNMVIREIDYNSLRIDSFEKSPPPPNFKKEERRKTNLEVFLNKFSIGDSCFIPFINRIDSSLTYFHYKTGKRFVVRKTLEAGIKGTRIWRVK
jgi:hypothetical protein